MNQEKVKQLLMGLGADENAVANAIAILTESDTTDLPFKTLGDYTEAANRAKEELYISKNKDNIIKEHEEVQEDLNRLSWKA